MDNIHRTVEECISTITDNYSVHPSGVVTLFSPTHEGLLAVIPRRPEGEIEGWTLQVTEGDSATVESFLVGDIQKVINKVQKWAWKRGAK